MSPWAAGETTSDLPVKQQRCLTDWWGVATVALAAVLVGTMGTVAQLSADGLSPVAIASWRSLLGATGLLVVTVLCKQAPWRYKIPAHWVALGGVGAATTQLAFFSSVDRTGVAVATLVTICTPPLAAGLLDWAITGHRPKRHWLGGVAAALVGVVLLSSGTVQVVVGGVALAVLAGSGILCQGFAAQQLMVDRPPLPAMATVVTGGAVLLLPITLMRADSAFRSMTSVATVVYLGLVTVTLSHTLWGFGLKRLRLRMAVVVGLLEPAVAAVLAMAVLAEPVTVARLGGISLIMVGITLGTLDPAAKTRKQPRRSKTLQPTNGQWPDAQ